MEVPKNWRIQKQRYSLEGRVCSHCGAADFPPRQVCRKCSGVQNRDYFIGENDFELEEVSVEENVGGLIAISLPAGE